MINTAQKLNKFVEDAGVKSADSIIQKLVENKTIVSASVARLVMSQKNAGSVIHT